MPIYLEDEDKHSTQNYSQRLLGGLLLIFLGFAGMVPVTIFASTNNITTPIQLMAITNMVCIMVGAIVVFRERK